mgnify:CR=1 FL=1
MENAEREGESRRERGVTGGRQEITKQNGRAGSCPLRPQALRSARTGLSRAASAITDGAKLEGAMIEYVSKQLSVQHDLGEILLIFVGVGFLTYFGLLLLQRIFHLY